MRIANPSVDMVVAMTATNRVQVIIIANSPILPHLRMDYQVSPMQERGHIIQKVEDGDGNCQMEIY